MYCIELRHGVEWPEVVVAAVARAQEFQARLLIVDTFAALAGLRGDEENESARALEAMRPIEDPVRDGHIPVMLSRHDRKSGGDVGDSARGSSAYTGAVDVVIQLKRPEGNSARRGMRVIHALSRFDETPDQLAIELTDQGYIVLGTETAIAIESREALDHAFGTSERG
jgi:hypothetical protein